MCCVRGWPQLVRGKIFFDFSRSLTMTRPKFIGRKAGKSDATIWSVRENMSGFPAMVAKRPIVRGAPNCRFLFGSSHFTPRGGVQDMSERLGHCRLWLVLRRSLRARSISVSSGRVVQCRSRCAKLIRVRWERTLNFRLHNGAIAHRTSSRMTFVNAANVGRQSPC